MRRPGLFIAIAIVVLIVLLIGLNINFVTVAKKQDLTYVGIDNMISKMSKEDQVLLHEQGRGATVLSGEDAARLVNSGGSGWQMKESTLSETATPTFTLYISLSSDYKVQFFTDEPTTLRIVYEGKWQDYTGSPKVIEAVRMKILSSSYWIPEEVVQAIAGGKRTGRQSVNDAPITESFVPFIVGETTYYLYEENGKYYVESPYQVIFSISQATYEAALAYTEIFAPIETPSEETTEGVTTEAYEGEIDSAFEKIGTLKSGAEVYFEKQGFFNKLEKGSRIIVRQGNSNYVIASEFPGRPEISPNGEALAFIDNIEFEVKGNAFIYNDTTSAIRQVTHYTYGTEATDANVNTVKDCLWLSDEELLLVIGYGSGTVSQGGDVYILDTATDEQQLLYKAKDKEEVANITANEDQFIFDIVYWTDENMTTFAYREEHYTLQELLAMKK